MNIFDQKIKETTAYHPLKARQINTMVVNLGIKCNLRCTHCFIEASPERTEEMSLETIDKVLDVLRENSEINLIELMGGAPELSPHFKYISKSARDMGKHVKVPSNLAVYLEPGMEGLLEFLAENKIEILASVPHYTEEVFDRQRGKGTYKKVMTVLKRLNELGYGQVGTGLELDIMTNPAGASFISDPHTFEKAFRDNLWEMHGISFNNIYPLTNIPIGRLGKSLSEDEIDTYMKELEQRFNPDTVENVMCGYLISVAPDGSLYDCDCAQTLGIPVKNGNRDINSFDYEALSRREITTSRLCFTCTAGIGQSCGDVPE